MKKTSFLINAISDPLLFAVYEDLDLVYETSSHGKCSEVLVPILGDLLAKYTPTELIYANGPGSYMGIKLSYTVLSTLALLKDIPLLAISAFCLNGGGPIRANKSLCICKEESKLILKPCKEAHFNIPKQLDTSVLSLENEPFYFLPAL